MLPRKFIFSVLFFAATTALRAAPVESQIEQARQFNEHLQTIKPESQRTGIASGEVTPNEVEEQSDLGAQVVLKEKEESQKPFSVFADVSGYYTDNVALARTGRLGDGFLVTTFGGAYEPKLTENLTGELSFRGGLFRYDKFSNLDFNSVDAGAGLSYRLRKFYDSTVYARYNFTDLISDDNGDEFLQNHAFTLGIQKIFPLARAHYALLGASAQWNISDPSAARRDEYSIYAAYHVDLTRRISADLGSRTSVYFYQNERHDFNESLSATLRFKVTKWLSLGATTSFAVNNSNDSVFDYHVFNVGGGVSANVEF